MVEVVASGSLLGDTAAGEAATASPFAMVATMSPVASLLTSFGLTRYVDILEEQGYDDVCFLRQLGEQSLRDVGTSAGMLPGHLAKFVTYMLAQR